MAPGRLVYVMGPSGAGKSRVIDFARRKIDGSLPVAFAHRYITRPLGSGSENYIALSPREFALRKARNLFAFGWEAYGFDYGIGIEINSWLASGLAVVIDGSRAHFSRRDPAVADAVPVLITAGRDELRRRLTARGREDREAVERRLERADRFMPAGPALVTLDNSGPIEQAGDALVAVLAEEARRR